MQRPTRVREREPVGSLEGAPPRKLRNGKVSSPGCLFGPTYEKLRYLIGQNPKILILEIRLVPTDGRNEQRVLAELGQLLLINTLYSQGPGR